MANLTEMVNKQVAIQLALRIQQGAGRLVMDDIDDGEKMSGLDMLRKLAEYAQKTVEAIDANPELDQESADLMNRTIGFGWLTVLALADLVGEADKSGE